MKKLKKLFFRLNDREQKLLLLSAILLLTLFSIQIFKEGVLVFQNYQELQIQEQSYQMELSLKPAIDRELEKQKHQKQNDTHWFKLQNIFRCGHEQRYTRRSYANN